jgi:hypothetical protein
MRPGMLPDGPSPMRRAVVVRSVPAGRHEPGVAAPYGFEAQGEAGQSGGVGRPRAPDASRCGSLERVAQRRWYCLLPNMTSQAALSAL